MRKTAWLMWEHGWLSGWQENLKTTWSANSKLVPFPHLTLYNKDWIPLLCPLICYGAKFPSVSHRDTLWSSAFSFHLCLPLSHTQTYTDSCTQLTLSACTLLTLGMYLWQQWWELSRDTWLIQPCSFHTPLPPFLFYFTPLHPQTAGQAGESGSAARVHVPRV